MGSFYIYNDMNYSSYQIEDSNKRLTTLHIMTLQSITESLIEVQPLHLGSKAAFSYHYSYGPLNLDKVFTIIAFKIIKHSVTNLYFLSNLSSSTSKWVVIQSQK